MRTVLAFSALGLLACSSHPAPVPASPMPASTKFITGNLEPMIVDWQPEQRGDLEISMREGLVIVGYDDQGFRLLKDCHVDGNYEFMGMTRRERVVRLESADDVKANLPLGGLGIAAKLGGEFEQGATLDIAMVMVGKLRTTWRTVTKTDLIGQCDHASHFVRGATVGAFAVDKGDRTHARAVAEIFGVGAGGGMSKSSLIHVIDGQLPDCQKASPDSEKAPSQCGALIRVELLPISAAGDAKAKAMAERDPSLIDTCTPPLVKLDGKCTDPQSKPTAVAECNYGEGQSCVNACKGENVKSCVKLSLMLARGEGVPLAPADAATLAQATCEKAQDPAGCLLYGDLLMGGSVPKDPGRAAKIYAKSCDDGEAEACARIGDMFLTGRGIARDTAMAARALSKGCKGGSHDACSDFGLLALGGQGFDKDLPTAAALFKRACDGDSAVGCSNFAYLSEFGQGTPKNVQVAAQTYAKACAQDASMCTWLGALYEMGKGVPKDGKKAAELYRASCQAGHPAACAVVRVYLDPSQTIDADNFKSYVTLWQGACQAGGPRDCSGLGVLAMANGQKDEALRLYARSCQLGDDWGCMLRTANPR